MTLPTNDSRDDSKGRATNADDSATVTVVLSSGTTYVWPHISAFGVAEITRMLGRPNVVTP